MELPPEPFQCTTSVLHKWRQVSWTRWDFSNLDTVGSSRVHGQAPSSTERCESTERRLRIFFQVDGVQDPIGYKLTMDSRQSL